MVSISGGGIRWHNNDIRAKWDFHLYEYFKFLFQIDFIPSVSFRLFIVVYTIESKRNKIFYVLKTHHIEFYICLFSIFNVSCIMYIDISSICVLCPYIISFHFFIQVATGLGGGLFIRSSLVPIFWNCIWSRAERCVQLVRYLMNLPCFGLRMVVRWTMTMLLLASLYSLHERRLFVYLK